jgi:Ca2+-binding EF-hand superfamily protein
MGCAGSRGNLDVNEKAITKGEALLGFQNINTRTLIEQIKKYQHNDKLNKNAFLLAATNSKLDITGLEDKTTAKGKFYDALGTAFVFPTQPLVLAAILLGRASLQDKAKFLFEEWDADCSGKIQKPELSMLLKAYVGVAINNLVDLGVGDQAAEYVSAEKAVEYKKKLVEQLDEGITKLIDELCKGAELTKDEFVKNITAPTTAKVLTTYGFRNYVATARTPPPAPAAPAASTPAATNQSGSEVATK